MGAGQSLESNQEYENAKSCFSQEERERISDCFRVICFQHSSNDITVAGFSYADFEVCRGNDNARMRDSNKRFDTKMLSVSSWGSKLKT